MTQNCFIENSFFSHNSNDQILIAGVDEVGRGALFGSVVAAVVVLPLSAVPDLKEIGVKDSKCLSSKKRHSLIEPIKHTVSEYQIAEVSAAEIDCLNIHYSSLLAMKRAVAALKTKPTLCLVDGKFLIPNLTVAQKTIVQGDSKSLAIAAASILAKVWRDDLIIRLDSQYPQYDLANNKGYPTAKHKLALQTYGACSQHRQSFAPCRNLKICNIDK